VVVVEAPAAEKRTAQGSLRDGFAVALRLEASTARRLEEEAVMGGTPVAR
jgi:hypothetical protein